MKLTAMALGSLAGLAILTILADGCGSSADPPEVAWAVRYGSDGTLVVFAGSAIDTYGPDLAKPKVHVPVPSLNGALFSVSDDGRIAALSSSVSGHQVALFDLSTGRPAGAIALGQSSGGVSPQGVTLSPDGSLLFVFAGVGGDCCTSGVFDTSTGARLWTNGASYGVNAVFSPDESAVYVSGIGLGNGVGLEGFDGRTGTSRMTVANSLEAFGTMPDSNTLTGVAVSVDPVSYAETTEIDLLSTVDGSLTGQVSLPANTEFAGNVVQPPAFRCAPAAGSCALYVVKTDPSTGEPTANEVQVWALDGTLVQSIDMVSGDIAISPDGQYVAAIYDGDVGVYRVSDGSQIKLIPYRNQIP